MPNVSLSSVAASSLSLTVVPSSTAVEPSAFERLQGAAVEEEQRRALGRDLAVDGHLAGEHRRARVDDEVGQLDRLAAAGQAEAAAVVIDLALDVRRDRCPALVRHVAAGDREPRDAGLRDLAVAHRRGRQLQGAERLDEARRRASPRSCWPDRASICATGSGGAAPGTRDVVVIAARGERRSGEHGDGGQRGHRTEHVWPLSEWRNLRAFGSCALFARPPLSRMHAGRSGARAHATRPPAHGAYTGASGTPGCKERPACRRWSSTA